MKKNSEDFGFLGLNYVVIILFCFFIYGIVRFDEDVLLGFITIITSTSILVTDYLTIAGFSATILNVMLILIFNLILLKIYKVKMRGVSFAAIFTVFGFAFFGKNILNILPIYFGTYLFSKYENENFSKYVVISMFATGLSPIVSFGFDRSYWMCILGVILGIIYGFVIPTFSAHVIRFHNGYSLYNTGFAGGICAIIIYGVLKTFNIESYSKSVYESNYAFELNMIILVISLMYLIIGLVTKDNKKSYKKLLSMSGRAVTDFTMIFGRALTYINIGSIGLIALVVILITRVPTSGVVFGATSTIIGFGAFGKHPKNIIPIMIGVLIVGHLVNNGFNNDILVAALFSTTLAPIAGDFGFVAGMVAGGLHYSIVTSSSDWQGGMNLYNNGFASGFVAAIMGSILDTINLKKYFRKRG